MAKDTKPPIKKQDEMPEQLSLLFSPKKPPGYNRRLTEHDYRKVGVEGSIEWIGDTLPKNNREKSLWHCKVCGYEWLVGYGSVATNRRGCPPCGARTSIEKRRRTIDDYHRAGVLRGIRWVGDTFPENTHTQTKWLCPSDHTWPAVYDKLLYGQKCSRCQNMVNGAKVSSQQEWLCDLVAGELNIYIEGYCIDITVFLDGVNIAIEYDGWHWHKDHLAEDAKRDRDLIVAGWRVLRVKSGELLPDKQQVLNKIKLLLNGSTYEEIILDDWGES